MSAAADGSRVRPGGVSPGALVGFLVCVELASGIIQGYYTPLLTDIARHLGIHDADVNWFEAAGLLMSALAVPVMAKLGDLHGYRRMLLVTASITAVASWGVAFASSFAVFVVAWALQAFYVAWLPLEVALIHARGRGHAGAEASTRRATGLIVAALQAGVIVGALAGGQLGVLAPDRLWLALCVPAFATTAVTVVIWAKVPEPPRAATGGEVDIVGVVLLSLSLLAMSGGLTFVRLNGAGDWWPWAIVALGLLGLLPFGRWELSRTDPLIDLRVLARSTMWPLILTATLFGVSVLGAQGPLSTFARTDPGVYGYGLGATSQTVSLLIGGYIVFSLTGALLFPVVSRWTTPRRTLILATSFVAAGYLLFLPFHATMWQVLANMMVAGLGSGALVAALPAAAAGAHRGRHGPDEHDEDDRRHVRLGGVRARADLRLGGHARRLGEHRRVAQRVHDGVGGLRGDGTGRGRLPGVRAAAGVRRFVAPGRHGRGGRARRGGLGVTVPSVAAAVEPSVTPSR